MWGIPASSHGQGKGTVAQWAEFLENGKPGARAARLEQVLEGTSVVARSLPLGGAFQPRISPRQWGGRARDPGPRELSP